ncbi:MAG: YihY/virulence factor BrkB family protein [Oscillospiraceae bacterium]|nr:YihY/virulence factor BrkB family protein [Oscillospiraceae bacterium]
MQVVAFVREITAKIKRDEVATHAAEAAFFIIIAFFPMAMVFLTLLNYLPFTAEEVTEFSADFLPAQSASFVDSLVGEIHQTASGAVLSIATVTALWSASRGLLSIIKGLNSIYGINERRGFIKLRIASMFYMLIFMATLIITLIVLVFGKEISNWLIETFPMFEEDTPLFDSVRWFFGFCLLISFFWALYSFAPGKKNRKGFELPGAFISAAGWVGFSALYSFYITNFGNFTRVYGSLTAIVLLMLWLYICMNIMFFGAVINVVLQGEKVKNTIKRLQGKITRRVKT